jgi:Flp pilus assembly protein TadG
MLRHRPAPRSGSILPLLVISLIALMGMIALAVDIGMVAGARTQAQDAADLTALAGARMLNGDTSNSSNLNNINTAVSTALDAADNNKILGKAITAGMVTTKTGIYTYDSTLQRFVASFPGSPGTNAWSVMDVTLNTTTPTYFGRVFGVNSFNVSAHATAAHRPRDLALILDFSGSMKFGSQSAFFTGDYNDTRGSLNIDSIYPKFGHYYPMSQRALATSTTSPSSNGTSYNPMQRTIVFEDDGGETHAANNLTATADGGPPIIQDFLTSTKVNAFYQPQSSGYSATQTPVATPAPDNFQDQSDSPVTYVGDKWPRQNKATSGTNWAQTLVDYFTGTNTTLSDTHKINTGLGGGTWEGTTNTNGYGANFKGYSMGPGYYGKTFWIWPPDPRWGGGSKAPDPSKISTTDSKKDTNGNYIADWRKRFFCYPTSSSNGNPDYTRPLDDNSILFDSSGYIQPPKSGNSYRYAVNYKAILAWLINGPQVLPPSLVAGRLVYYDAIPTDIPLTGGDMNQCFWRDYINAVLGIDSNQGARTFYGTETASWGTVNITAKTNLYNHGTDPSSPYMQYNDNPIRPRAHFWFGPLTMCMFLTTDNTGRDNMWPGTCHESHCWQLKAAINSALDDIKNNHPNDWASLIFFSDEDNYATARVPLSRNYSLMKNALFYPFSLLNNLSDTSQQIRPYAYSSSSNAITYTGAGDVPNANGGTCPEMGFQVAYNQFSGASGYNGRRGASKVVIFETDGVPNTSNSGTFQNNGAYKSIYTGSIGSTNYEGNNDSGATDPAVAVVTQICALDTASSPGYSTSRNKARVHSIAFGDLFETTNSTRTAALAFLLRVQKAGNTSASSDTSIETYKIITGDYTTRITNLKQAFERIMQSGIQVSLIQ